MSEIIQLSSVCNRSGVSVINQPQLVYLLTEIIPQDGISQVRMPLNFALVLDRSGSMAGEKLRTMIEAVNNIIDQLDPSDVISIITFESKTQVIVPAQQAANKDELKKIVNGIKDGGATNMASGIREGIKQVNQYHGPDRISRIILLTDGEATDKEDDSRSEAGNAGGIGIPIVGLGFGKDWNEDFIIDLSDRSQLAEPGSMVGTADFIKSPDLALEIFQHVYQSMQVVAQNMQITTRIVQGIEARRVWQVLPVIRDIGLGVIQGRAIAIPVGELDKSGSAYLIELMLPPRQAGIVRIAQTDVTYETLDAGSQRQSVDIILNYTNDQSISSQLNHQVMNIVEKVQAFKLQTQALSDAEGGNVGSATRKLRQAVTMLLNQGEEELAAQIQDEATQLEKHGELSSEGKKTIKLTSRKTVRLSDLES